jgi:hypothetical protein
MRTKNYTVTIYVIPLVSTSLKNFKKDKIYFLFLYLIWKGFAMGLPVSAPVTAVEIKNAQNGNFCYYTGKAYEAVDFIRKKIYEFTPQKVKVCVLPTELYFEGKLYELPIFRIIDPNQYLRFIDNCGRYYKNFSDFLENNKVLRTDCIINMKIRKLF